MLFGFSLMAQDIQLTGTVTNADDGMVLPGVSVVVKGTTIGTTTSADGTYSLAVPADATIVFSFIGMKSQEIALAGQTTLDIKMEMEATGLEEIVVTAFGITREKKAVAYQTQQVDANDLVAGQATRTAEGLVGKVAGLQINVQDNGVNPNSQILLRGMRSISGNNEALIVIDGAIATTGAFDDLNPNDIQSVNVLKGATAAALYGSDAKNGALIVVTKQGTKNQRFTVGINNTTTFEKVAYMPDFQSEHGTGWDGAYDNIENTNWGPRFDGQLRQIGPTFPEDYPLETQMVPYAPVQDNLKDFFNTGQSIANTVYFQGGDETSKFYLSLGNQDVKGLVPDDVYSRYTFRANASKTLGKLELGVNASYMSDETDVVGSSVGDQDRPFYWFLLNTPANIPLSRYSDWDNPESYGYADNYYNAYYQNPYWAIGTNRNMDKSNRILANVSAAWSILDNLTFSSKLGVNSTAGTGKNWRAAQTYNEDLQPAAGAVSSFVEDSEFQTVAMTGDALLTGTFNLTQDLGLKTIVGSSVKSTGSRSSLIRANNLSIPDFYDISNGTGQLEGSVNESTYRTYGFFGDITLNYKKWAYLNLTGRQDYTSTLSPDNNSYFYPGAGLSVVLSEAISALNNNPVLSFAKITLNNSTVYSDLAPFQISERYYQSGAFPFGSVNGFYLDGTAVDESIQKEKLSSTEIGANLAFYQGRITFDASYFMTKTTNLITYTTPSSASDATSILTNIGALSGNGIELSLGTRVLQIGDVKWDINLNYTKYDQVVDEIKDGLEEIILDESAAGYGTYAIVGETFPQIKAVAYERDSITGKVVIDPADGNPIVGELKALGKTTPDYILGLNTQLSFKGIEISATADYRTGHVYYSQGSDQMEFTGRSMESIQGDRKDFVWPNSVYQTGEDAAGNPIYTDNTNIQITGGIMDFWQNHYNVIKENYVKDATAFKLREVAVSYTLPTSILQKTNAISKIKVGFVARNVMTILPEGQWHFSDPEFRNTRSTDDPNGIGIGGYLAPPPTRSYGFNINIEF